MGRTRTAREQWRNRQPWDWQRCLATGKRGYLKRKRAAEVRKETARAQGEPLHIWNTYTCPDCGLWHIGHLARRNLPQTRGIADAT